MKAAGAKGSTTPQGKHLNKGKSLKRAGSPALSESSGNESSRKKIKKTSTAAGSRAGTPGNAAKRAKAGGAGSGSDGEGGDMSDGAAPKRKIKLVGSARGTPSASRAGSPAPAGASPSSQTPIIEPWEILEKIPAEGILIADLIKPFQPRVGNGPGKMPKTDWIKLVTQLCAFDPADKKLRKKH